MCSMTVTTATGAMSAMAPMSNFGKLMLGRPIQAASAMGAKSTMPNATATA